MTMFTPAQRIQDVQEYYFSRKLKQIEEMRQQGCAIINLGIGNPDLPPPPEALEILHQSASQAENHGYQSYVGIPELRAAFANWYSRWYGVQLNAANEILPLMGSKEGIMHISMAFLNPGDGVLVPDPGYPTYAAVSKLVEAQIHTYPLHEKLGWKPDLEALEQTDLTNVKLMWINYPNMPTGANGSLDFFEKIVAFGKKHHILICNDNPYSFILNPKPISILQIPGAMETALELNSMSKSHNMAGWRIGMVAAHPQIIQHILKVKSNMDSGMYKPLQLAAAKALSMDQDWFDQINGEYAKRRTIVWQIMEALKCKFDRNQTGLFVWAQIPEECAHSESLSDLILGKAHVFITPGSIFGAQGNRYIRISLCIKTEPLEESLKRIQSITTSHT